jgi:hypothetical protein
VYAVWFETALQPIITDWSGGPKSKAQTPAGRSARTSRTLSMITRPDCPSRPNERSSRTMLSASMFRLMSLFRLPASPRKRPPIGMTHFVWPGAKVADPLCRFQ